MKNIMRILFAAIAVLAISAPANAQFRWGVKAGVQINSISLDSDVASQFSSENTAGFTGGLTTEFTVPIVGIGFDASLMYVHRGNTLVPTTASGIKEFSTKGDYLQLPINLKYKIGIPAVGNIITPYIFTGPSFAVRCSKEGVTSGWKEKKFDAQWNIGLGLQLVNHLQVGASYGIGMTKALEQVGVGSQAADIKVPNCWTVTAAYLF